MILTGLQLAKKPVEIGQDSVLRQSLAETKRLIDTYFPHENLQMVIIGKADEIREQVGQYGEVSEVGIQQNGFTF